MSKPEDIPQDIRKAAANTYARLGRGADEDEHVIALAIMASFKMGWDQASASIPKRGEG